MFYREKPVSEVPVTDAHVSPQVGSNASEAADFRIAYNNSYNTK